MKRSRIDELIMKQEGLERLTRAEIRALQLEKLNRVLEREALRGGYYRDLPRHLSDLSQIAELPFTTQEQFGQEAHRMLLVSQADIQKVISGTTSGTTGVAKRVFYTREDCENTIQLFMAGLGEFIFPGNKTLICMPFSGPFGLGELIEEAIHRLGAETLPAGPWLTYGEYGELLEKEKPDTFVGMPVQLLSLLRVLGRGSLERALVSGDACPARVLASCEKILGTKLFPHYGSREMGLGGAITCQAHEGMHLRENHVIAEIIDAKGNPVPDGTWGELVITTIGMEAMPLIRYRTGDYTRILPGICPCGSEVIRLDEIRRKGQSDWIRSLDDRMFALEWVVDYAGKRTHEKLQAEVLVMPGTDPEKAKAVCRNILGAEDVRVRQAEAKDRSLYKGKRILNG